MKIFTIGFTHKSAEEFFSKLSKARVTSLVDIRINRTSQLAGFSKEKDLKYFLKTICDIEYLVREDLAPSRDLLKSYRGKEVSWGEFEKSYLELISRRGVLKNLNPELLDGAVLLCSEAEPTQCHRRLLAEALSHLWGGVQIVHL